MDKREVLSAIVQFDSFLKETNENKSFFIRNNDAGRMAANSVLDQWNILQDILFEFVDKLNDKTKKILVDEKMNDVRRDVKQIGDKNNPKFLLIPHLREVLSSLTTLVKSCK